MMIKLSFSRKGRENRSVFSIEKFHEGGERRVRAAHGMGEGKPTTRAGRGIEKNNGSEFVQGTARFVNDDETSWIVAQGQLHGPESPRHSKSDPGQPRRPGQSTI